MKTPKKDKDGNYPVRLVLAVEGVETSDGRTIRPEALDHRALPLSILGLTKTTGEGGHAGAEICGRLDTAERVAGQDVRRLSAGDGSGFPEGTFVWRGTGVLFPDSESTTRWLQGGLRGNSVDLTAAQAEMSAPETMAEDEPTSGVRKMPAPPKVTFTKATIAATTLCPVPAFEDAYVEADFGDGWEPVQAKTEAADDQVVASLVAAGQTLPSFRALELGDFCSPCAADEGEPEGGIVAAAPPAPADAPEADLFTDPQLQRLTRLTVLENGELVGHIAGWKSCHTSYQDRCVKPPRSRTDYAVFHGGSIRAQVSGSPKRMSVGQLTIGGGHARQGIGLTAAMEHYDNVGTAVADIAVGEDKHGIWAHGVLRPGVTSDQLRALEGAKPSGDWRRYEGNLELMAVHCVNVAGYPVLAAQFGEEGYESLVAAGALEEGVALEADPAPPEPGAAVLLDYDVLAERIAARLGVPFRSTSELAEAEHKCAQSGCGQPATTIVLTKGDGSPQYACGKHTAGMKAKAGPGATTKALADDGDLLARRERILLAERRRAVLASGQRDEDAELVLALADDALNDWFSLADTTWWDFLEQLDSLAPLDRDLMRLDSAFNWVSDAGGLPGLIRRVADHLMAKGMAESHAIATAVNTVKRYCKNPDGLNFPGSQNVKAGTVAKGCAAVAQWEAKKAKARAT